MSEKRDIDKKKISYEGLFRTKELYATVQTWAEDNKYELKQERHAETVSESGKELSLPLELEKKSSDYVKFHLKCSIDIENLEDVMVKKGEKQEKMHKGSITVNIKAVIETDYEDKWHKKPFWMFLKGLHDKFLKAEEIKDFEKQLKNDLGSLNDEIKAHLNLFKYRA